MTPSGDGKRIDFLAYISNSDNSSTIYNKGKQKRIDRQHKQQVRTSTLCQ